MSSDLDKDAYLELMQESASTGKSVQQILAERKGLVYHDPPKNPKMADEVRKTLAENTFRFKKENQEENNEK